MSRNTLAWLAVIAVGHGVFQATLFAQEPHPYSEEWWQLRAQDPPGARQVYKHGKLWPPYPRPCGPKQTMCHSYHHATFWPYPYNCMDRDSVYGMLNQQAANGWVSATTLHEYHFDEDTQQLNSAGQRHLAWIVFQVPQEHRSIFVAQNTSPEIAQARLAEVHQELAQLTSAPPPVSLRYAQAAGRPAVEIDMMRRRELQTMPAPRLQFTVGLQSRSVGGAGGGAAGQGAAPAGGSSGGTSGAPPVRSMQPISNVREFEQ